MLTPKTNSLISSSDGSPMAISPTYQVWWCKVCAKRMSRSGSPDNPGKNEHNRKRVSLAARNWEVPARMPKLEVPKCVDSLCARRLGQKDLTRPKSEEDSLSTRQPAAVSPKKKENMIFSNYPFVERRFFDAYRRNGEELQQMLLSQWILARKRIDMENVHDIVDEVNHPPWARFLVEFGKPQEYKIREHRESVRDQYCSTTT